MKACKNRTFNPNTEHWVTQDIMSKTETGMRQVERNLWPEEQMNENGMNVPLLGVALHHLCSQDGLEEIIHTIHHSLPKSVVSLTQKLIDSECHTMP